MKEWLSSMKAGMVWIPASLFIGILIGGYGPRHDLTVARAELDILRSQESRQNVRFGQLTGIIPLAPEAPRTTATPETLPEEPQPDISGENTTIQIQSDEEAPAESLATQLEAARDLWDLRMDVARQTFLSRTMLNTQETAQFDVLMAAMNLRIRSQFEALAEAVESRGNLTAEETTRMFNEVTGALMLTYSEMDRVLPATWRDAAGPEMDLFDFVDPSVAEPLLRVESILSERGNRQPMRRRRW